LKNFDTFIFDLDGTLASTNKLIFDSFNFVTKKYLDKEYSETEIISLFGPTEDFILRNWMKNRYEEARLDYYNFYSENHDSLVDVYPEIEEILDLIKSHKKNLGIFTGKGEISTKITLEKLGFAKYFDIVITGDDVKDHKPSPEGIINIISHFSSIKENTLMIGDAPADIIAARHAGIEVASVIWDSYSTSEILSLKADYIFHNPSELKDFIIEILIPNHQYQKDK